MNDVITIASLTAARSKGGRSSGLKDIAGKTFGRLTVIKRVGKNSANQATWLCVCSCVDKTEVVVSGTPLRCGHTKSCGCIQRETASMCSRTHGFSGTGIYKSYISMLNRCFSPVNAEWEHYGGRGITVCHRWLTIENFMEDMMPTWKEGLSLDRINVNGNYEPTNCRWITMALQQNNRRNNRHLTIGGRTQTIAQWSAETGVPWNCIYKRAERGWPHADCIKPESFRRY